MSDDNILTLFPGKKIKPFDGMAITADVWEKSHSYHEQVQQSHNLFFHGSGILTGLEVIASDPPDRLIYVLPGVAVDSLGQLIVLSEPVAYDIGDDIEGPLYLFISYRKSIPPTGGKGLEADPVYTEDQFLITARPSILKQPAIELARFNRQNRAIYLKDAQDPQHPQANEIDLRFRPIVNLHLDQLISAAVVYLGDVKEKVQGHGLARLNGEIRQASHLNLVVDDDLQLDPNVLRYSLIYLVGEGTFQLSQPQLNGLQGYLENGGTLLLESCDEAARNALLELCTQLNAGLQPLTGQHPVLTHPFLFPSPPRGFESEGEVSVGDGLLLSSYNYGRIWNGEAKERPLSREEMRSTIEWCVNILSYALERSRL